MTPHYTPNGMYVTIQGREEGLSVWLGGMTVLAVEHYVRGLMEWLS